MRIVIAITGASGAIYGIRLLEAIGETGIETHLILSDWAKKTIEMETDYGVDKVIGMASRYHENNDLGACVSSGSFQHDGMVVAPCSMKTLACISHGLELNLIARAAGVTMKEHRRLILMPRESPLTSIHLENMLILARMGVLIMPPIPAFHTLPDNLAQLIDATVGRVLDHLGVEHNLEKRWGGMDDSAKQTLGVNL